MRRAHSCPHPFPSAAELRTIDRWIAGTTPRLREAEEYAAMLNAPVDRMREIVRERRSGAA